MNAIDAKNIQNELNARKSRKPLTCGGDLEWQSISQMNSEDLQHMLDEYYTGGLETGCHTDVTEYLNALFEDLGTHENSILVSAWKSFPGTDEIVELKCPLMHIDFYGADSKKTSSNIWPIGGAWQMTDSRWKTLERETKTLQEICRRAGVRSGQHEFEHYSKALAFNPGCIMVVRDVSTKKYYIIKCIVSLQGYISENHITVLHSF